MTLPAQRDDQGALRVGLLPTDMRVRPIVGNDALDVAEFGAVDRLLRVIAPPDANPAILDGCYTCMDAGLSALIETEGEDAKLVITGPVGSMTYELQAMGPDLLAPSVPVFAVTLALNIVMGAVVATVGMVAVTMNVPNEVRGLAIGSNFFVSSVFGTATATAPVAIAWLSTVFGGEAKLGLAIATIGVPSGLLAALFFALAIRDRATQRQERGLSKYTPSVALCSMIRKARRFPVAFRQTTEKHSKSYIVSGLDRCRLGSA